MHTSQTSLSEIRIKMKTPNITILFNAQPQDQKLYIHCTIGTVSNLPYCLVKCAITVEVKSVY